MNHTRILLTSLLAALLLTACAVTPEGDSMAGQSEAVPAARGDAIKIGMISTLTGPASALGVDVRDGFLLGVKHVEESMGDQHTLEVIVKDDQQDPNVANQAVEELLQREQVDFLTGVIFSNILLAISDTVFDAETFYISPNAGPSQLAGEGCSPYFFNVAWQNDNLHEAMGQYVADQGHGNVFILAPDYPAGHDALAGFKRMYGGDLADELYTQLGQLDFAVEIELIRAAAPDAVFTFQPGGMGINFIKQYAEAGLIDEIPLYLPGFSADQDVVNAVGDATEGLFNSSHWTLDLDNEANARFIAGFEDEYGRTPTLYASQGYDAALLIASAVAAVEGDLGDADALSAAIQAADFDSVRGDFEFNTNHFPIQDYYLRQVVRDEEGNLVNSTISTIFENHADAYAGDCTME